MRKAEAWFKRLLLQSRSWSSWVTPADVQEIKTSLSKFPVYGERMGEAHMSQIDYTIGPRRGR